MVMDIGHKPTTCLIVGMGNVISRDRSFTCYLTYFGHNVVLLLLKNSFYCQGAPARAVLYTRTTSPIQIKLRLADPEGKSHWTAPTRASFLYTLHQLRPAELQMPSVGATKYMILSDLKNYC